jgi:Sec-independent protein translocase protein TatA
MLTGWTDRLGIVELILFLIVALIVIPPDHLPEVMRSVGKVLRELRLASNTVMRELSGALDESSPPPAVRPDPRKPDVIERPDPPAQT